MKFLRDLKPFWKESVIAPLFKMMEAVLELFVPLVMKDIIDVAIPMKDTGSVLKGCGLLVGFAVLGLLFSLVAQFFAARAATGFSAKLRQRCFDQIQKMSFPTLDRIGTSTLLTRMTSDINQIQDGTNMTLRLFMRSPVVVFGAMIMAILLDPSVAWIFILVIVFLSAVVLFIMLGTMPRYREVQKALDSVTGKTRDNLTGVRVVRAFRLEEHEEAEFTAANEALTKKRISVGKISAMMNPLTYVIVNIGIIAVLYSGAVEVNIGTLTQGAVIALVNYMGQILEELVKLADLIIKITKAAACGKRISSLLSVTPEEAGMNGKTMSDAQPKMQETQGMSPTEDESGQPAVSFNHVSFTYEGARVPAVSDITFSAARGETIGIIGGTGSGKSTLIHLIPGFYPISAGSLQCFGTEVSDWNKQALRSRIAVVLQKAVLFQGTIRDNLLWGNPDASDEDLEDALKRAQIYDTIVEKGGLSAEVEQEGRNFSGGQKQRIAIARALVRKPEILIFDDSSSALDFATDAALREEVRKMSGEMTIIIVSQRAASVMNADRILVLEDGRSEGLGTHEELLKNCEAYREIYESQFR